jgi:hypothetical protein
MRTALPVLACILASDLATSSSATLPQDTVRPIPDFPAELRRPRPVEDIRDAVVYTINERIESDYGLSLARKVGSDVLVRGWFKWRDAPDWSKFERVVPQAHALGSLFGAGITCSALFHGENGLTEAQVLDMATRGPDGKLVDAWGEAGTRHGTLSNPAYLEYLLKWCRLQIDAGADYLFLDEHTAALQRDEGFDDYSVNDFRDFLLARHGPADGWPGKFQIDVSDRAVCPDGTIGSFRYLTWLARRGLAANPYDRRNPLAHAWHAFRQWRDDRAWRWLTDAIRSYAAKKGRRVLVSANGHARYVDLQVLGVWGEWRVKGGRVDLSESQIHTWGSTVRAGWALAGRRVPVVLFHDWGFGGFPWLKVPPADRKLWMRVRGAEIYAAGGFFAFPVHGPFGQDALRDGTLREVARQTAFYQRYRDLFLKPRLLGFERLDTEEPLLSLALWLRDAPPSLLLHVVNRQPRDARPTLRRNVAVRIPTRRRPTTVRVVSPDWDGEKPGTSTVDDDGVTIVLPRLEAYAVAVLEYDAVPDVALAAQRIVPTKRWARPDRSEFVVGKNGTVEEQWALNGYLQGRLHTHLRNPPTFVVNLPQGGALRVHVAAVAVAGARLECLVDGRLLAAIDLPDRDGKNDGAAREIDRTVEFAIPRGRHRIRVRNTGGDWLTVGWYAFVGEVAAP